MVFDGRVVYGNIEYLSTAKYLLRGKKMLKRWASIICLIIGAAALWIYGKHAGAVGMGESEREAEPIGMENMCFQPGGEEQGEPGAEVSYEVYVSQYTLSTGYAMKVFQVSGMKDKVLENRVNESLNSKLYILEEPWFLAENISENKPSLRNGGHPVFSVKLTIFMDFYKKQDE